MNTNDSAEQQKSMNIPGNSQFPMEFWANVLARSPAANAPPNIAIAAAAAALFQQQQQPINTNIRLPPPFNLTATIQHLLSRTPAFSGSFPHQNPAFLLQQALLGHQIGLNPEGEGGREAGGNEGMAFVDTGGMKKEEEGEEVNADLEREIGFEMDGNPMNIKNEPNDGGVNEDEAPISGQEGDEEANTNEGTPRPQQQRRPRVGGSSAKTAEVWKFFTQRPDGEQAATCSICSKTIKATNSSTTGMIRHLRSCHHEEYQVLQKARILRTLKNADDTMRVEYFRQMNIPVRDPSEAQAALEALENSISAFQTTSVEMLPTMVAPKYSVESLINPENRDNNILQIPTHFAAQLPMEQRQLLEQIENFKTMSRPTSIERQQQQKKKEMIVGMSGMDGGQPNAGKRAAMEEQQGGEGGIGQQQKTEGGGVIQQQNADNFREPKRRKEELPNNGGMGAELETTKMPNERTTPKNGGKKARKAAANANLQAKVNEERGKESARISEQMAAMFLVDNTEFLLERIAFRQFIHSILPNYQMPSKEEFCSEIIPRVARQLEQLTHLEEMQRNNPFGLPFVVAHQSAALMLNSSSSASSSTSACISSSSTAQSASSPILSTPSISNNSVISPSSSAEESGFHEYEESPTIAENGHHQQAHLKLKKQASLNMEELAQLAATRSQTISTVFTYSIDLNAAGNEGTNGIANSDTSSGAE